MSPTFITSILGLALMVMTLGAVSPSVLQAAQAKKVELSITREEALSQQLIRYRAIVGTYPADLAALTAAGYWKEQDKDNGYGSEYSFSIDSTKGLITVNSTIVDGGQRAAYLSHNKHSFRPIDAGNGVVTKTFVIPSAGSMSAPMLVAGGIPAGKVAPPPESNTYWYNTNGLTPVLMVSDGVAFKSVQDGTSFQSYKTRVYASVGELPSFSSNGDIQYVNVAGAVNQYVFITNAWYKIRAN